MNLLDQNDRYSFKLSRKVTASMVPTDAEKPGEG